jgi:putative sugar O-methyltransferase
MKIDQLKLLINDLRHTLRNVKLKLLAKFKQFDFVGAIGNRSVSDNGEYVASVNEAISSYKAFSKFKRDPRYQAILEHVTYQQGHAYLEIIKSQSPSFLFKIDVFKLNDLVGGAKLHEYEGIGAISPSTLRYLKVASDLIKIFGNNIGDRIAEIGVGYGGQLLIVDKIFNFEQYDLFDLPVVLLLATKYIESHTLNSSYHTTSLNQHKGDVIYDLVISNYAFSELPSELQTRYIEKIILKSKRGYLTMNSGKNNCAFTENKLTLNELKKLLPRFEIIPESPLTHPGNYIIIWGHN